MSGATVSSKLPEEDLSCPVCCDIFRDPVLLPCSHSFCRSCLQNFWESSVFRSCPVCRRRASRKQPPSNLALRNLCEAFVQSQSCESEKKAACPQHGEKLKLFCVDDKQSICVVCQASRMHKGHHCAPTDEAALDCKVLFTQSRFVLRCTVTTLCLGRKMLVQKDWCGELERMQLIKSDLSTLWPRNTRRGIPAAPLWLTSAFCTFKNWMFLKSLQ